MAKKQTPNDIIWDEAVRMGYKGTRKVLLEGVGEAMEAGEPYTESGEPWTGWLKDLIELGEVR